MGARIGRKDAIIAILLAVIIGLIVWSAVRSADSPDRDKNDAAAGPATEANAEPVVELVSQPSPDGSFIIESYGQNTNIAAGGSYPAEGIRLRDAHSDATIWSMEPGYYKQEFKWSPDSRYVSVYYEAREHGETIIVDAQEKKEIALPGLDAIRAYWGEGATINESRPDPYIQAKEWLGNTELRLKFQWSGDNDTRFEGEYTYDAAAGTIVDLAKASDYSSSNPSASESMKSGADEAMDKLAEAINNSDAAALQKLLLATDPESYNGWFSVEFAQEAIEKIERELDLGTIGYKEDVENADRWAGPVYQLTGKKDGAEATVREPIVLSKAGEQYGYKWAYFRYLVYADDYMAKYLKLIQAGDAKKLAAFLVEDDLGVPEEVASKLIKMYRLYFGSTDGLKLEYAGPFLYRIYQEKGRESHAVSIRYGDGLMGISDAFMPSL
ncbi:hypothetical protein [Cohnella sp. AR92]|uniref:hypothetical protein n=1 Tax=Cohnella sp. AR92 TaxID=648716 RepID=UPI000F8C79F9|nr:hypothetical protein [Cohnella sp. AR92]RUS47392.1 hypothetical protein ELR57_09725 [Cohnella sp. AR92]